MWKRLVLLACVGKARQGKPSLAQPRPAQPWFEEDKPREVKANSIFAYTLPYSCWHHFFLPYSQEDSDSFMSLRRDTEERGRGKAVLKSESKLKEGTGTQTLLFSKCHPGGLTVTFQGLIMWQALGCSHISSHNNPMR